MSGLVNTWLESSFRLRRLARQVYRISTPYLDVGWVSQGQSIHLRNYVL